MSPSNQPATELDGLRQRLSEIQQQIAELEGREPQAAIDGRTAMDAVNAFVCILSPTGIVGDVNSRALEISGLAREELIGRHLADIALWDPASGMQQTVGDSIIRAAQGNPVRIDVEVRPRSGESLWLDLTFVPALSGETVTHLVASGVDITPAVQLARQTEQLKARLADSTDELNQFAYAASHDLQEPLRTIVTHAQLLVRRHIASLDSDGAQLLEEIEKASTRMRSLILDLLTFSRVVHAPVNENSECDATAALQWTMMNLSDAIKETGATITYDPLPRVRIDDSQLVQLLQNLIGNALKFKLEEPPAVHVSVEDAGEFAIFSVRDNGPGIDPQYHERVFGVFKRLHGREYPGNGIGLSVCSKIIGRWGGRIWVESEPGKGATFKFTLRTAV